MAQYFVDGQGYRYSIIYVVGWGIWTGIIFAASGIVGLIGAFKPSKCMWVGPSKKNLNSYYSLGDLTTWS